MFFPGPPVDNLPRRTRTNQTIDPAFLDSLDAGTDYTNESCADLLSELSKAISKIVDKEVKEKSAELNKVEKDSDARKAGGYWDKITEEPLAQFEQSVGELANPSEIADMKQDLLGNYTKAMELSQSYTNLATQAVSGVVSNVVNEIGVVGAITDAVGLGSVTPTGESAGCDENILVGTVGTVFRVAGRAVNNATRAIYNVQATVGLAIDVVPDLYTGLMSLPAGALSVLLTNREILLTRISTTVDSMIEISLELEDDDYPFDHKSFVQGIITTLQGVDSDLNRVEGVLEAGGNFLDSLWKQSISNIEDVAEDLLSLGLGPLFLNAKLLKLMALEQFLVTLIDILDQREQAYSELVVAIGGFSSEFRNNAKFDNLMAPIVQQVRCQLQRTISDMEQTVDFNAILRYYVKEKQWGVFLYAIAKYMRGTGVLGEPFSVVPSALNDATDALSASMSAGINDFASGETYQALTSRLNSFNREVKRKVVRNIDPSLIVSIGAAVKREIESLLNTNSQVDELLSGFTSQVGEIGATVLQGVSLLMNFMGEQGLSNMIDALKTGDLGSFFSATSVETQLESVARQAIGKLLKCCSDNAGDGDATNRLMRMNREMIKFERGKDIFDRYAGRYAENFIKNTTHTIIPGLRTMKSDVNRVGRARCINQGESGTAQAPGLILV